MMSWVRSVTDTIYQLTFLFHRNNWRHYTRRLEEFHGRPAPRQTRPTWSYQIMPTIIVAFFGLRALVALSVPSLTRTPYQRLVLFTEMIIPLLRHILDIFFVVWSCIQLLTAGMEMTCSLQSLRHLTILVVEPDGVIKPRDLNLNPLEFEQVRRFREHIMVIIWWTNTCIAGLSIPIIAMLAVGTNCFSMSWQLTTWWLMYLVPYVCYVCYSTYNMPTLFVLVIYYLATKQTTINNSLARLNGIIHSYGRENARKAKLHILAKFYDIYRHHLWLTKETEHFNDHFWGQFLSCLIFNYSILLTYLIYAALLLDDLPGHVVIAFVLIWSAHVATLVLSVLSANVIPRKHRTFCGLLNNFYNLSWQRGVFSAHDLFMVRL